MCNSCPDTPIPQVHALSSYQRRDFIKRLSLAGGSLAVAPTLWAASPGVPKPDNVLNSQQALERLLQGNQRYVKNKPRTRQFEQTRKALAKGQNPYACILSCADSRISPEFCFDEERGDLFVTRVAGNFASDAVLASLEYGTAVLGASLIMVLGHTSCGAVKAAIKAQQENHSFPGHIQTLTTALAPAVREALPKGGDLVESVTLENIRANVRKLRESNPLLTQLQAEKKLQVVGGLYHLDTGRVELVNA